MTTISSTTLKIRLLKKELKRLGSLQKEYKNKRKHNHSTFDKIVSQGVLKAVYEGRIEKDRWCPENPRCYYLTDTYKELHEEAKKYFQDLPILDFPFSCRSWESKEALTAGYILYNELRDKKPHLDSEEKRNEYLAYINKWNEGLESILQEVQSHD